MNVIFQKVYIICVVSVILLSSCGQKKGLNSQSNNNEAIIEDKDANDIEFHQVSEESPKIKNWQRYKDSVGKAFSIVSKDSVVLNDSIFYKYPGIVQFVNGENDENLEFDSEFDKKYQIQSFLSKENSDYDIFSRTSYILDSIPLWEGMYALLFSNLISGSYEEGSFSDAQGWLVVYSSENQYIDSRLIYQDREVLNRYKRNIYSEINLSRKKLKIHWKDFYEEAFREIPVVIHENGTFEEFPDIPFSQKDFAVNDCNSNGLYGKFPSKQDWTLLELENKKITQMKTSNVAEDELGNTSTQFLNPDGEALFFNIAFKGAYSKEDIKEMTPVKENDESIKDFIEQNIPTEELEVQPKVDNIHLYSIELNQRKFWMAMVNCSDLGGYSVLIGITPDKNVILLADRCAYNFHIINLKTTVMLYVENTSCGEGAIVRTQLYKMETGFEKVFDEVIICD